MTSTKTSSRRRKAKLPEIALDPVEAARAASLVHVSDDSPGIRRRRSGPGFTYTGLDGKPVRDRATLGRIRSLAIPPAWTDIWICPDPDGHVQASGRDAKGRKQYRYHTRWREVRDETKYHKMLAFGQALPRIREQVHRDLSLHGLPRRKVLAAVIRLLEMTLIRVGNEEYVKQNRSYGLTTLRNKHVDVKGSTLRFHFRGKSGKVHDVDIQDRRLARIVRKIQAIPGQVLFQYLDDEGQRHTVESHDVNEYLHEVTGEEFSAKDFRTWAGTVLAALALQEIGVFGSQAQAKKNVVQAIERVAQRLGNTPAVCRKCYVHPAIVESYMDGAIPQALAQQAEHVLDESRHELHPEESAVLALLQVRLENEAEKSARQAVSEAA